MKDRVFLDTNVVVYLYSKDEPKKRTIAQQLLLANSSIISTQVLQEFANISRKKHKAEWSKISDALEEITSCTSVFTNEKQTVIHAIKLAEQTKYSFYDSLIIAAALANGCHVLYSEDLQHNQLIEKKLRIVNPFL